MVVAVVAHAAGLPWAVALALGAMVSPPDPVAATAVARRLRLPHRLVTILEGEGLFDDATAFVAYKVAIVAAVTAVTAVTGDITAAEIGLELVAVIHGASVTHETILVSLLVAATMVVFRAVWIFPAAWLGGMRVRRRDQPVPTNWRESAVISWAGMRGVITVATALALPTVVSSGEELPARDEIVASPWCACCSRSSSKV